MSLSNSIHDLISILYSKYKCKHDEIIIDAKKDEVEKLNVLLKECMENVVKLSVPLKIDINCGINWYDAK